MPSIKIIGGNGLGKIRLIDFPIKDDEIVSSFHDDSSETSYNPRKRQKLDHLTDEEKMLRRKILNRQAAQIARDKKKSRLEYLESCHTRQTSLISSLTSENSYLKTENQALRDRVRELEVAMSRGGARAPEAAAVRIERNESAVEDVSLDLSGGGLAVPRFARDHRARPARDSRDARDTPAEAARDCRDSRPDSLDRSDWSHYVSDSDSFLSVGLETPICDYFDLLSDAPPPLQPQQPSPSPSLSRSARHNNQSENKRMRAVGSASSARSIGPDTDTDTEETE